MSKLEIILGTTLLILILILGIEISRIKSIPELKLTELHNSVIRTAIKKDSIACYDHLRYVKNKMGESLDPRVIRSVAWMDSLMLLHDSSRFILTQIIRYKMH